MPSISRRGFVVSAAAASAAFGLDGPLEIISAARAQGAPDLMTKGFAKFKVGDLNVTTIFDGTWEKAHDAGFIKNASLDETKAALKAAGLTEEHVPIPFTVTVIERGGEIIMFDSGTGGGQAGGPKAGLIDKQNMKAAGIDPAKIAKIVVTHYHGDHISGLMEKGTNKLMYPNAEIIVPAAEHKYWTEPGLIEKLPEARRPLATRIQATIPTWKNVRQAEAGKDVLPGIRAIDTQGHTPGHTAYEVTSGNAKLLISGDMTNIQALFVKNPGWHAVVDQDAALAEKNRRAVFEKAVVEGAVVTGYHWGMPGAGTIKKDGNGYALVPVTAA